MRQLERQPGLGLIRASRWVRTPPLRGGTASGWFLNGVGLFRSTLPPQDVLTLCRELETRADRRRTRHWGDRTLDLDVLLVEGVVRSDPDLVLPHPAIGRRPFVLHPLLEVWPDAIDPRTGTRYRDLPDPPGPRPVFAGVVARRPPVVYQVRSPPEGDHR